MDGDAALKIGAESAAPECRPAPEARLLAWLSCARLSGSEASELALNPSPHEPDADDDGDDDDDEDADDGDDDSHDQ